MWQHKTTEELERENIEEKIAWRKGYLKKSSLMFLIILFILPFMTILKYWMQPDFIDIFGTGTRSFDFQDILGYYKEEFFSRQILFNLIISAVITVLLLRLFRKSDNTTVICSECLKTKNPDKEKKCSCGGIYESLDYYKWIEEA